MSPHWTYGECPPSEDDLAQGDILEPREELRSVFQDVLPHFADEKYRAFLVLTQSCDLVRRKKGACRAQYVNLAVVRSLDTILLDLLDRTCGQVEVSGQVLNGVYYRETMASANQLLERLFNQNEQGMGLFYLHPDDEAGVTDTCVALLQVSVALRAHEHYATLLTCRRGRLAPEFQNRLGWLVGNLYSRVAVPDWHERGARDLKDMIRLYVEGEGGLATGPHWVAKNCVKNARKRQVDVTGLSAEEAVALLDRHGSPASIDVALERIMACLREEAADWPEQRFAEIERRLRSDVVLRSRLKK